MTRATFRLLGPLEVAVSGQVVPLGGPRRQAVLAMLLVNYGQPVSLERLIEAVWDSPPANAGHQVRNRISELRGLLRKAGLAQDTIGNAGTGYAIGASDACCDLLEFEQAVRNARQHSAGKDLKNAERELSRALALWRGTPLEGLTTVPLTAIADGLAEQYLLAREDQFDVLLELGQHDRVIAEIQEVVAANPWRERLFRQLITALYRAGRQPEALRRFAEFSKRLSEDLGLDPSPQLVALRDQILRHADGARIRVAATSVAAGAGTKVAWHLPAPLADFVGRQREVDQIEVHLRYRLRNGGAAVVAVSGLAGVGKTSLAITAVHKLRHEFPAGQLYIDLRGHDEPVAAELALRRLLRMVGVPADRLPDDAGEAAALYRSTLSSHPRLVLLDNAAGAAQVVPILPPPECPVLITSRQMITDLDGACFLTLEPLPISDAVELLARAVGWAQVARSQTAAESIVASCGGLPLAVRIAAAQTLATESTLDEVAGRLLDESRLLDQLTTAERSVRASLGSAYQSLDAVEQRLLAELATATADQFPEWIAGVLGEGRRAVSRVRLSRLVQAGFITALGRDALGQLRFRLHDLVRQFARERAAIALSARDRREAVSKVGEGWHTLADQADKALYHDGHHTAALITATEPAPVRAHLGDPAAWFGLEIAEILDLAQKAAVYGPERLCWMLIWHCETYLSREARHLELIDLACLALDSAQRNRDEKGVACAALMMAHSNSAMAEISAALDYSHTALMAAERVHDRWLLAEVLAMRARLFRRSGDFQAHKELLVRAIPLYLEAGEVVSGGAQMVTLGELCSLNGDSDGDRYIEEGLALLRSAPAPVPLARGLRTAARRQRDQAAPRVAATHLREALALLTKVRDPIGELCVSTDLAIALLEVGEVDEAKGLVAQALSLVERVSGPHYAAYAAMGSGLLMLAEKHPEACAVLETAANGLITLPSERCRTLVALGREYDRKRDPRAAQALQGALEIAERINDRAAAEAARLALATLGADPVRRSTVLTAPRQVQPVAL